MQIYVDQPGNLSRDWVQIYVDQPCNLSRDWVQIYVDQFKIMTMQVQ